MPKLIGIGYFNATSKGIMDAAKELGKTPIECRDFPGFVANRVLMPMINEAVYALMEGVAKAFSKDFRFEMKEGQEIYEKLKFYGFPILVKEDLHGSI